MQFRGAHGRHGAWRRHRDLARLWEKTARRVGSIGPYGAPREQSFCLGMVIVVESVCSACFN